jgi:hypothetical protein
MRDLEQVNVISGALTTDSRACKSGEEEFASIPDQDLWPWMWLGKTVTKPGPCARKLCGSNARASLSS